MEIHFSIDDVIFSLQELTIKTYKSIFSHPFYSILWRLHKKYGCVFSLYVFAQKNGFAIEEMTCRYREEFLANSDWLCFGYHAESAEITSDLFHQYNRVNKAIEQFAGQSRPCKTLRLHGYYATQEEIRILATNGVKCLLCADDNRVSYNLPFEVDGELNHFGYVYNDGLFYRQSDIRLENHTALSFLNFKWEEKSLVVFTHEWCFYSFRKPLTNLKANLLLKSLTKETPQYVFNLSEVQ